MKKCTKCAELIQDEAIKCRFCGALQKSYLKHTIVLITVCLLISAISYTVIAEQVKERQAKENYATCKENLKKIGFATSDFISDHPGKCPNFVSDLVPEYLKEVPTCPSTGTKTYRYFLDVDKRGNIIYMISCDGRNHKDAGQQLLGYPMYTSKDGLIVE